MKVVVGHKKQNNKKFYMLLTESLTAWLLAARNSAYSRAGTGNGNEQIFSACCDVNTGSAF